MKISELMAENKTSMMRAEKDERRASRNLQSKEDLERKAALAAKYNSGEPTKVKLTVYLGPQKTEQREFTIDNLLDIRRKIEGMVLIDMSKIQSHKGDTISYSIKKDGRTFYTASLPEYLFDLPSGTKQKTEFIGKNDLRRITYNA